MRDDQLLPILEATLKDTTPVELLRQHNIVTYSDLFALIKNEKANPYLREEALRALLNIYEVEADKRRIVPLLISALKAKDTIIRGQAARALGRLQSRRAVPKLINVAKDTSQSIQTRFQALDALSMIGDERSISLFRAIIDNASENIILRTRAIEELFEKPNPIEYFLQLLSEPDPNIRFWATYRLATGFHNSPLAISILDPIVAFDHRIPVGGLWHIDREAMLPLEALYHYQIVGQRKCEDELCRCLSRPEMLLISPAPEYTTFEWRYMNWTHFGTYTVDSTPEIHLRINPEWLAEQLRMKWTGLRLNIREPRPQAYLLDWHLQVGEQQMIGGLHRDQYAVVITGFDKDLLMEFTAWYRTLFPTEQHLYLYEWAGIHTELKRGMSGQEIQHLSKKRWHSSNSASEVRAEDLTFG